MRATTMIYGFIIFALFTAGFVTMMTELQETYSTTLSVSDLNEINKLNQTYDFTVDVGQELEQDTENIGQEGVSGLSFADKVINSLKVLYRSVTLIPQTITHVAGILNLPDWLVYGFLAIVILALLIGIVMLIIGVIKGVT